MHGWRDAGIESCRCRCLVKIFKQFIMKTLIIFITFLLIIIFVPHYIGKLAFKILDLDKIHKTDYWFLGFFLFLGIGFILFVLFALANSLSNHI